MLILSGEKIIVYRLDAWLSRWWLFLWVWISTCKRGLCFLRCFLLRWGYWGWYLRGRRRFSWLWLRRACRIVLVVWILFRWVEFWGFWLANQVVAFLFPTVYPFKRRRTNSFSGCFTAFLLLFFLSIFDCCWHSSWRWLQILLFNFVPRWNWSWFPSLRTCHNFNSSSHCICWGSVVFSFFLFPTLWLVVRVLFYFFRHISRNRARSLQRRRFLFSVALSCLIWIARSGKQSRWSTRPSRSLGCIIVGLDAGWNRDVWALCSWERRSLACRPRRAWLGLLLGRWSGLWWDVCFNRICDGLGKDSLTFVNREAISGSLCRQDAVFSDHAEKEGYDLKMVFFFDGRS